MKIAALYDIHGNFPAMKAVLAELEAIEPDLIIIGGDIVSGLMPSETLDCLLDLRKKTAVKFIRGNGDREVVEASQGLELPTLSEQGKQTQKWTAEQLTDKHLVFLANLDKTITVQTDSIGDLLFCHAAPNSDSDLFTCRSDEQRLQKLFGKVKQHIVVCGHTHMQFMLTFEDKSIYNAGSVGMPFAEQPGAYWLLVDGDNVEFKRTDYDLNAAARLMRHSGDPFAETFINDNLLQVPTEEEALKMLEKMAANK